MHTIPRDTSYIHKHTITHLVVVFPVRLGAAVIVLFKLATVHLLVRIQQKNRGAVVNCTELMCSVRALGMSRVMQYSAVTDTLQKVSKKRVTEQVINHW